MPCNFEMWITREGPDDSTDYKVLIEYEHDAYGLRVWMSEEEAKLFGPLTETEREKATEMAFEEDRE